MKLIRYGYTPQNNIKSFIIEQIKLKQL